MCRSSPSQPIRLWISLQLLLFSLSLTVATTWLDVAIYIYIHVGDLVLRHGKNRRSHALPPPSAIKIKMMNPSGTAIVDFQLLENPLFIHFLGKPLLALIFLRPCLCSLLRDTLGVGHCNNLWFTGRVVPNDINEVTILLCGLFCGSICGFQEEYPPKLQLHISL